MKQWIERMAYAGLVRVEMAPYRFIQLMDRAYLRCSGWTKVSVDGWTNSDHTRVNIRTGHAVNYQKWFDRRSELLEAYESSSEAAQ